MVLSLTAACLLAFAAMLVAWSRRIASTAREGDLLAMLVGGGYCARVLLHLTVIRNLALFSHGGGGDYYSYELLSRLIAETWRTTGLRFVTTADMPALGNAPLLPNMLALIRHATGGSPAVIGTAMLAFCTCGSAVLLYHLARDLGASEVASRRLVLVLLFTPGFVFYTSDVYKDGLVLFFVTVILVSSVRLSDEFSAGHLVALVLAAGGLSLVRGYLVYVCALAPLTGFLVAARYSAGRLVLVAIGLTAGTLIIITSMSAVAETVASAETLFETATDAGSTTDNSSGASGVTFGGGGPWSNLGPKLAYTLLSPFPWTPGSVGLHLGKVDALVFYAILYQAARAGKALARERPAALLTVASFVIPATLAYAATMANIGLIVRQRMPIVAAMALLAAVGPSLLKQGRRTPAS